MPRGAVPLVLLALLAAVAATATASGRGDAPAPARIIFSSSSHPAFGEHIDVVAVDREGRPRRVGDLGPGMSAVASPDGRRVAFLRLELHDDFPQLYVMNRDGSGTRRLTDVSDLADLPPVWSPDGQFVAFVRLGPTIVIAAVDGSSVRSIATESALSPAWSPDGRTIAYTTQSGGLFLAEPDGSGARRVGAGTSAPKWAPRGRRLAVVRDGRIWIVDPDTGRASRVAHGTLEASSAHWSPDGRRLAFIRLRDGAPEQLWTVELATGRLQKLTDSPGGDYDQTPSWSPNGRWLAFASGDDGFLRIARSDRRGAVRALPSWPPRRAAGRPSWLPDGRLLLSARVTTNDREIWIANADGSGARALTANRVPDVEPTGSPDGRRIAYIRIRPAGGKRTLHVMRADGSASRPLLARDFPSQRAPAWSPTSGEIAFESGAFIYLVAAAGGTPRKLVAGSEPAWASNGRTLAFYRGGIWLIERDGTGLRRAPGFRLPSLAPDGRRLAFQRPVTNSENGIFVADLRTKDERLLVSPGRDPAWSPDGGSIAYDTRQAIWTIPSGGGQPTRVATSNGIAEHVSWLPAVSP